VVGRHPGHTRRRSGSAHGRTDGHCVGEGAVGCIEASLDEVLALGLGDERLQFGGRERVDQAGFRDDEKENLCAGESGKFVGLFHDTWAWRGG
jgi:hypothetical protein